METLAPPVVAVVVAHDPGPWFEETLASLASQDYAELSVLVLDAGQRRRPHRPGGGGPARAYVRRFADEQGIRCHGERGPVHGGRGGTTSCCATTTWPSFPDAVHLLVEEAFRSNAGIVSPKVVSWDDPSGWSTWG